MKTRDPYHQALAALTTFVTAGRFGWGEPLVVTALAEELGLSPTPVREALARLSGEGLIEHRPGRGYQALSPTVEDIVDFYEMHQRLVHWALDLIETDSRVPGMSGEKGSTLEGAYVALVRAGGSVYLAQTHWRTCLNLRSVRLIETRLRGDETDWLLRLSTRMTDGDLCGLRREVEAYHRDRFELAPAVAAIMRRPLEV
jgi:DNA-binding transcriptional regulator YhcF (GntR family)